MAQRQIPGSALVDEIGSQQFQIPGGPLINETLDSTTLTLSANSGSFTLTAPEISFQVFEINNILTAESASFIFIGNATIASGLRLTADGGTFSLSVAPSLSDVQITASAASFTLTGFDAALSNSLRRLTAAVGTFTFLGNEVVLTETATPTNPVIPAETGSFTLTGRDATLIRISQTLTAASGSFVLTGGSMVAASSFAVETGTFTMTGKDATFALNAITEWTRRGRPSTTWTRI